KLRTVEGALLLAAGRRDEAKKVFIAARDATSLRMLDPDPSLDALFAKPTRAEIEVVSQRWALRDLSPKEVEIVHRGVLGDAEMRIVAHRVHGSRHYGAVIVPRGASKAPVIVEAKGVSPSYFALDLARSPIAPEVFGKGFIYFLPSYRGEVLQFDGKTWTSEGDRTDVWDGATDDFIAFTSAALTVTPEADGERMCAFGKSRGGTVALLAGIRDKRFDCVVAWAAPSDHFFEMVQSGWTPLERVAEGVRVKADVFGMGGQFIETFLSKQRSVAETRLHLIASSPLWFAERLPPAQAHYGLDDNIVSAGNGRALAARNSSIEMIWHAEAGHDLDKAKAASESKRFVLQRLMPR
ncbi:MAG TPA: prolyl oligopeptidase family serine peptidase, partial [Thermoanaerobaculia bacterium]|nr:prolyl oligopeptidase family serine peptidase [Thermoanaerobaculia bacterium]